jgi:hypothetical protein
MDILDRFLGHDAYTTRLLLERCQPLADAQLDHPFPIGPGLLFSGLQSPFIMAAC